MFMHIENGPLSYPQGSGGGNDFVCYFSETDGVISCVDKELTTVTYTDIGEAVDAGKNVYGFMTISNVTLKFNCVSASSSKVLFLNTICPDMWDVEAGPGLKLTYLEGKSSGWTKYTSTINSD